jgi:hypothetical protein
MIQCDKPFCCKPAKFYYRRDAPSYAILIKKKWPRPRLCIYARCSRHKMRTWSENSSLEEYITWRIMVS